MRRGWRRPARPRGCCKKVLFLFFLRTKVIWTRELWVPVSSFSILLPLLLFPACTPTAFLSTTIPPAKRGDIKHILGEKLWHSLTFPD